MGEANVRSCSSFTIFVIVYAVNLMTVCVVLLLLLQATGLAVTGVVARFQHCRRFGGRFFRGPRIAVESVFRVQTSRKLDSFLAFFPACFSNVPPILLPILRF